MTREELKEMSVKVLKEQVKLMKEIKADSQTPGSFAVWAGQDTRDLNQMQKELWDRGEVA